MKGDKGDAGKSAYESAVAGGYTGTEAQFNKDLATDENTYVDNETTVSATENKDGTVTIKAEQKERNFDGKDITINDKGITEVTVAGTDYVDNADKKNDVKGATYVAETGELYLKMKPERNWLLPRGLPAKRL